MNNKWNKIIYKIWSPIYDRIFNSNFFLRARKQVFQEIHFNRTHRILFVGVGTGADLELVNHADLDITAIDFSPDMLGRAKAKFINSSITFIEMDAQKMKFDDRSFDYVVGSLILSVVPRADQCFQEMSRVLKQEGRIVIFDKFAPDHNKLSLFKRLLRPLIKVLGTDIGLNFEELYQRHRDHIVIEEDKPVMLNGMYRKIILRKIS